MKKYAVRRSKRSPAIIFWINILLIFPKQCLDDSGLDFVEEYWTNYRPEFPAPRKLLQIQKLQSRRIQSHRANTGMQADQRRHHAFVRGAGLLRVCRTEDPVVAQFQIMAVGQLQNWTGGRRSAQPPKEQ